MKLNQWFFIAAASLCGAAVLAQDANPAAPAQPPVTAPPPAVAPAVPAVAPEAPAAPEAKPEAKPKPHRPKRKNQIMKYDTPMSAEVKDETVNVRGQPSFVGEVIGHLHKGETVTVYETITLGSHEKDEPAKWDRIDMPTNHLVWVDGLFVDKTNQVVKARKLNLRGGPGENYSVVGVLEKGAPVVEVKKEKGWIGIVPPTNSYAYVAAECLNIQGPAATVAMNTPPPAPTPVQVPAETPPPAPAQTQPAPPPQPEPQPQAQPAPAPPPPPPPVAPAPTAASQTDQELTALRNAESQPTPALSAVATPPATGAEPPRIVTREGYVHRALNIQAPADYELRDIKTGDLMDFLQPPPGQNFKIYLGTRVSVTGSEGLDSHWPRTPILQVQSVDLLP